MSGTFPSSPGFRAINMRGINRNYVSETTSGRRQARNRGGQQWAFTAQFPPMKRSTFNPILAFVTNQDGAFETFQIVLPELSDASGSVSGSVLANGAASIGDTSLNIDGITGTLASGDFFKFANHSKVYMATADRAGAGSLSFKPPLVAAVADNEAITYDSVPFTVRLENDVQEFDGGVGGIYGFELDMVEDL